MSDLSGLPPAPVLYTEDDENDAFLMRHAFARSGVRHALVVVSDGQQAIDHFAAVLASPASTRAPLPALTILDLNLPVRSGFEVLSWIRRQPSLASVKVVILSSSNHTTDIERARALGADQYFVKPSNVAKQLELVQTLRDQWLLPARPLP